MKWNQCIYCGQFISYDKMENCDALADLTPDSAYTTESIEYYHVSCLRRANTKDGIMMIPPSHGLIDNLTSNGIPGSITMGRW